MKAKAEERYEQIVDWLRENRGQKNSQRLIAESLGTSQQMISRRLLELLEQGRVKRERFIGYQVAE